MLKKTFLFGLLSALLFFSGCLTVDYSAEQEFREDGTSALVIDDYIGINSEALDMFGDTSLLDSTDASSVASRLMLDFYSSRDYPEALCGLMEGVNCHGDEDGRLYVEAELQPGGFYDVEKETDWVNLKEKTTYSIEKVPMGQYYAYKGRDEEIVSDVLSSAIVDYGREHVGDYITKDYYCTPATYSAYLECGISSISGGTATVELTGGPYSAVRITEVSCSGEDSDEFLFVYGASDAKAIVEELSPVDRTLQEDMSTTVGVSCPTTASTIVVFYETRSYYSDEVSEEFVVFDIRTKEELKQEADDALQDSVYGYDSGYTGSMSMDEKNLFLNFQKGEFMGVEYDELSDAALTGSMMQMEINVEYVANFPDKVTRAEVGGKKLSVSGKQISFGLEELEDLPEGRLIVTTEKDISPLGIFTWVVVVLVLAALAYLAFMRR